MFSKPATSTFFHAIATQSLYKRRKDVTSPFACPAGVDIEEDSSRLS